MQSGAHRGEGQAQCRVSGQSRDSPAQPSMEAAMAWELRTAKESLGSELRFFGPQNVRGCSAEINDHSKASSASFPRKTPAQNG